jgi:hypothetical protein
MEYYVIILLCEDVSSSLPRTTHNKGPNTNDLKEDLRYKRAKKYKGLTLLTAGYVTRPNQGKFSGKNW